jgi:3-mercaptopyruvate sulfurtransferase SseA
VRAKQFYIVVLIAVSLALPATAQTSKRKSKPVGKAAPAQQPKATNQPDELTEEDRHAAENGRITTHELKRKLDAKADIVIVDNRDGRAWIGSSVKLPGAIHIPLSELQQRMHELPQDKEIITYCT